MFQLHRQYFARTSHRLRGGRETGKRSCKNRRENKNSSRREVPGLTSHLNLVRNKPYPICLSHFSSLRDGSLADAPNETDNGLRSLYELTACRTSSPKSDWPSKVTRPGSRILLDLGHRAYKDLFSAANASMLTAVVQRLIVHSYSELVTVNPPRTSLLAAVSQQHAEIMAGCRVLTEDEGILSALIDAANAATTEAFQMIYAERPEIAVPPPARPPRKKTSAAASEQPPAKKARRARSKSPPQERPLK